MLVIQNRRGEDKWKRKMRVKVTGERTVRKVKDEME